MITVDGGGVNGQAGAVKMGIARALILFNPELRPKLKAPEFCGAIRAEGTQEVRPEGRT